jgi:hypothetical protein
MNTRLLIPFFFAIIVLAGLFVRKIKLGIRVALCVVFSLVCSLLALAGSLAPHRMAEEKIARLGQTPSAEWINGALATRDVVYVVMVFWLLPLIVLSVLCIYLLCQKSKKGLSG